MMAGSILNSRVVYKGVSFVESSLIVDPKGPSAGVGILLNMQVSCPEWTASSAEGDDLLHGDLRFELDVTMAEDSEEQRELMRASTKVLVGTSLSLDNMGRESAEKELLENSISLAYSSCRDRIFLLSSTSPMNSLILQDIDTSVIAAEVLAELAHAFESPAPDEGTLR